MTHPFTADRLREIVQNQIEEDERLGERAGGSGHLSHTDYAIDAIGEPKKAGDTWKISYRYTVSITTEFTIYPDNPPYETGYEKTITVNSEGDIVGSQERRMAKASHQPGELLILGEDEDSKEMKVVEDLVQKVVDLETGRDITGEYVSRRLRELEVLADEIIQRAKEEAKVTPQRLREIYEAAHGEIHERLGMGSIGPATAAAGPLMAEKKQELADALGIK